MAIKMPRTSRLIWSVFVVCLCPLNHFVSALTCYSYYFSDLQLRTCRQPENTSYTGRCGKIESRRDCKSDDYVCVSYRRLNSELDGDDVKYAKGCVSTKSEDFRVLCGVDDVYSGRAVTCTKRTWFFWDRNSTYCVSCCRGDWCNAGEPKLPSDDSFRDSGVGRPQTAIGQTLMFVMTTALIVCFSTVFTVSA